MAFEACSLAMLLTTRVEAGKNVYIFSLIVDLHELDSMGIESSPKMEEFGKQIRSYMRIFEKLKDTKIWLALLKTENLREYLSNVSSECRLARFTKLCGFDVKLMKHQTLLLMVKKLR